VRSHQLMVNAKPILLSVAPRKGKFWPWPPLLLVLAVGTVLRFHLLGVKSLWLDEVTTVGYAQMPWPEFLRTMWWGNGNMVFYYSLLRVWQHLGDSEFCLRSLSALFGIAAIPATYALGNRFLSRKAGLFAACLLAVHSFHIQYSQEVRSYSFLVLLLILCAYAFLAAIETPERTSLWALYILLSTLAIYTQVFAVFVLASQWLVLTPYRIKRLGVLRLLSTAAAIGILAIPIAAVIVLHNQDQVATWSDFYHNPGLVDMSEVLQRIAGAKAGDAPTSLRVMILLTFYVAAWVLAIRPVFRPTRDRTAEPMTNLTLALMACWLIFPIVAMFCFSFLEPIFHPRYLLMCVPAAALLAGQGLAAAEQLLPRGRIFSLAAFLLMVVLELFGTRAYYSSFKGYGNDWRGVTQYILSKQEPEDAVIFYTFTGHREFEYYVQREREAGRRIVTPTVFFPLSLDPPTIKKRAEPYHRVWLILHQTIPTLSTEKQSELIRSSLSPRFRLVAETEFPGAGATRGESGRITVILYTAASPGLQVGE
jgi:mannosyltransferase